MDQLKEILRQAIKYRFWIAVGISALLPMIAYFVGSGPIKAKAATEETNITNAHKGVQPYKSGAVVNAQYKPIVEEKTEVLTKDVEETWKKLFARQAPLLTWPERVADRFPKWGRKWPEDVDPSAIQIAIIDYVTVYPKFVTEVYKTCNPFDPIEGTGVVSAPPEAALLRPSTFTIEAPPALGKVWAAQERLWIQRTLLDVVRTVNGSAKDWDGAIIKQINTIEVGTPTAQDQRSLAKGETVEIAPAIDDPSKPAEATAEGGAPGEMGMPGFAPGMTKGMSMPGMEGGMGGAMVTEDVYYVANPSTHFKIMPVRMSVLVDQNRVQDLLVALENSPMTIQVMDFEFSKPTAQVVKPEKGNPLNFGMYGMSGEMMMPGMMPGMGAMSGMGGAYARSMRGMMGGMGGEMMPGMGMSMPGMGPGMGMGGMGLETRKGVDKRQENLGKKFQEQVKSAKSVTRMQLQDPYYNIVEVTIHGQARFFNDPAAEVSETPAAETTTSPGDAPAAEPKAEPKAEAEAPKTEPASEPKAEPKAEAEASKTEPATEPKGEAPKAEPKAEAPPQEPAPKAEASSAPK